MSRPKSHSTSRSERDAPRVAPEINVSRPNDSSSDDVLHADATTPGGSRKPRFVLYGNVPRSVTFLEQVRYPRSDEVEALGWCSQALRAVAIHKQGVVVWGEKGVAKSVAAATAVREFREAQTLRKQNDNAHKIVAIRDFPPMSPKNSHEFVQALYKAEMGEIPSWLRFGGDLQALEMLIGIYAEDNVGVLVFEEADTFPTSVLTTCRDIMAQSAPAKAQAEAEARGPNTPRIGTGILLIGTVDVLNLVRQTPEWGERWRKDYEVKGVTPDVLARVYANLLSAFRTEADRLGKEAWESFIRKDVAPYIKGSLRRVESHVDQYLMAYADNAETPVESLADVKFDDVLFMRELKELAGSKTPENE